MYSRQDIINNLKHICDLADQRMVKYENDLRSPQCRYDKRDLTNFVIYDIIKIVDDHLLTPDMCEYKDKEIYFRLTSKIKSYCKPDQLETLSILLNTMFYLFTMFDKEVA